MIHPVTRADAGAWSTLRQALWPETPAPDHALAIERYFWGEGGEVACLVAQVPEGIVGFVELSVRWAPDGSPAAGGAHDRIAYLEGWYVHPAWRHRGIGRALVSAGEAWARAQRCQSFASECPLAAVAAQALHHALGFRTSAPLLHYRKPLTIPPGSSRVIASR